MNIVEIIKNKRDGKTLTCDQIKYVITGYTHKKIPDYQMAAFLMAAFLNGLNRTETACLTEAMLNSGKTVNLNSFKGKKIDKHSTGGVGDKTSLIIAPVAAAAGIYVPMISGRGLGHTGGTLDKLESIPGFRTNLTLNEYKNALRKCGAVLIGQTEQIAPADKLIYSLRDVTATVESIPLITSSIMSKKLAEGIDGLVLDIKTGNGAFMKNQKDAGLLAKSLISTAKAFGKSVIAFITDMNQPLGNYIGNELEVYESVKVLKGETENDLYDLSVSLAGAMIKLGGKTDSIEDGKSLARELIRTGKAFNKFLQIVELQGGNVSFIRTLKPVPDVNHHVQIKASASGYISEINTYNIGIASLELGAGRKKMDDKIDHKAGIILHKKTGDEVRKGDLLADIFTNKKESINIAKSLLSSSIRYSGEKIPHLKLIKKIIQ
ncbi:MAG: thymidine phosphorylase [Ignavibacteriaceae bacterium]